MHASGARLLLVCLGCPKQERWIWAHHHETGIPLSIGVGASLDFITGKQVRAPRWMQKSGLEWFWRMSGSPARLVSRYYKDFLFLVNAGWRQARSQRRRKCLSSQPSARPAPTPTTMFTRIIWSGDLHNNGFAGAPLPADLARPIMLDASGVSFMDSSGLGRLASLVRNCQSAKQWLVVVRPTAAFRSVIEAVRMEALFPMVATEAEALAWVATQQTSGGQHAATADGVVWVSFNCALDASYYDKMMALLDAAISDHSATIRSLVVDLNEVSFIDSRAVGGLIRAWKTMGALGGTMFLARARPGVREILSLLHLDKILPEWKGNPPQ